MASIRACKLMVHAPAPFLLGGKIEGEAGIRIFKTPMHIPVWPAFPCTRHDRCKVCRNNRRVGDSCPSLLFAWSYHYPLWLNCVTDHDIAEAVGPNLSLGSDFRSRMKGTVRSEEHTSELQSLMRISYAVFCLKTKKKILKNTK